MKMLLKEYHDEMGHPGRNSLLANLKERWYWMGMKADVAFWLASSPLTPIIASRPRERCIYDITYMPEDPTTGDKYVLVFIDSFTKFVWACPLETREAAFHLWQSDNGGEFKNKALEDVIGAIGGTVIHSTPRHPQTNGQVERVNGTLSS